MNKKFIILLLIAGVLGAGFSIYRELRKQNEDNNIIQENGAQEKIKNYQNSEYGISIDYPGTWQKKDDTGGSIVVFLSPFENKDDIFSENVNLFVEDLGPANMTLDEYTKISVEQLPEMFPGYALLDLKDAQLSGLPAKIIKYTTPQKEYTMELLQAWTVKDQKAYVVTYAALQNDYDKYIGDVQAMIDSFKITK